MLWQQHRPKIVAPLGNDAVIRAEHPEIPVETRDWGGSVDLGHGVMAHLEPAYHWSARGINDRRMALWCAYVLTTPAGTIYHIGDTGFGDGKIFHAVRERFGKPRLAHLPIGAYEPRWFMEPQHMNPEDAVKVLRHRRGGAGARPPLGHVPAHQRGRRRAAAGTDRGAPGSRNSRRPVQAVAAGRGVDAASVRIAPSSPCGSSTRQAAPASFSSCREP